MNDEMLQRLGLSKNQARAYIVLVKYGSQTAKQISERIRESRTNTHMILKKMAELGLIVKEKKQTKTYYVATSPSQLEQLIVEKRNQVLSDEKAVKEVMPTLLSYYYSHIQRPGVRYFTGKEGIRRMYQDHIQTGKDIYFLRSDADYNLLGDELYGIVEKERKLGIKVFGIEPYSVKDVSFSLANDERMAYRKMQWLPKGEYSAPVNLYTYGDKTALISYGEELNGTIIESPQIAEAMRQIFVLLSENPKVITPQSKRVKHLKPR